jgi:hypothetical protein
MADSKISALPASTNPLAGTEVLPIVQSSTTKQVSVANLTAGRDIAATSLTTAAVQATNSGGLALKNSSGTTQLSVGAGGGDNITLSVATNITPANAAVAISPTGTGTVTINPNTASSMNNVAIGGTTPLAGSFTTVKAATTMGVGAATPAASGAGITFPATQSASSDANTLDDYEEGTWTPTDGSGAGLSLTVSNAVYIKIGQMVYVATRIVFPVTASAAVVQINGLPFTTPNVTGGYWGGGFRYTDFNTFFSVAITPSATDFTLFKLTNTQVTNVEASGKTFDLVFMFRATA